MQIEMSDLPKSVNDNLLNFVEKAKTSCENNLISVVLFGSAAEGRLRPTSDVNLILILQEFNINQINQLRETLRVAHAAIRLNVMFILESELETALEVFAVKFTDILSRHCILFGSDPFKNMEVSRKATLQRLQQVITNLILRLRERYAMVSLREEQLVPIIADISGPIRSCAGTILSLEGFKIDHPKEALQLLTKKFSEKNWEEILHNMSVAREKQELKPGEATSTLLGLLQLLNSMQKYIQGMN